MNKKIGVFSAVVILLSLVLVMATENPIYTLDSSLDTNTTLFANYVSSGTGDVAYIYSVNTRVDPNVMDVFSSLNLKVDLISVSNISSDLSKYRFIFVGEEPFTKHIPVENYRSIIFNHYIGADSGITDRNGVSSLTSTESQRVAVNGNNVIVYSSFKESNGVYIPYYFLSNAHKSNSTKQIAGTYSSSSGNFGDVISFIPKGSVLSNGKTSKGEICFFGITKSNYWTNDAKNLFKNCIGLVNFSPDGSNNSNQNNTNNTNSTNIICSKDSDCGNNVIIGSPYCSSNSIFDNFLTFKCNNAGTNRSFCSNSTIIEFVKNCSLCDLGSCLKSCNNNSMCDDNNTLTEDICANSGSQDSYCANLLPGDVVIDSFVATSTINSVTLNFSAGNKTILKNYLVSSDNITWKSTKGSGYIFSGLISNTYYHFYAKAVDKSNRVSNVSTVLIKTLEDPATTNPGSGGGGGGGSSSSSTMTITSTLNGYSSGGICITKWSCTQWGECKYNDQTRVCSYPENWCTPKDPKPNEIQTCIIPEIKNSVSMPAAPKVANETISTVNQPAQTNSGITGGVIGAAGKYSILGIIAFLIVVGAGYTWLKFR